MGKVSEEDQTDENTDGCSKACNLVAANDYTAGGGTFSGSE